MREAVGKLKRDADFMLPRACKKARSSVHHFRNANWEFSQRPRRSIATMTEVQTLPGLSNSVEELEEDLGEVALALLEMSSPSPREGAECGRLTPPPAMNSNKAGLGAIKSAQSALQLKSNTLKAKPTIIITSGSSTDTSPAEAKSTASEGVEGATSAGQITSPSSNQGSGLIHSRDSLRSTQTLTISSAASGQEQRHGAEGSISTRIGHTVSTGILLPNVAQMANKKVRQDMAPKPEQPTPSPDGTPSNHPPDLHTQIVLQQVLQSRLATRHQPGRPIAKTRGGNLIVVPDPAPKSTPALTAGTSIAQLHLEDFAPMRSQSPAGFPQVCTESQQLTLSRYPTLVLSSAHKPTKPVHSEPRASTLAPPLANNAASLSLNAEAHRLGSPRQTPPRQAVPMKEEALPTAFANRGTEEKLGVQGSKEGGLSGGNGASSGEESSEDDWLPNWSLNLYNALNPSVITTGQSYPCVRSTSQSLDVKASASGK